MQDIALPKKNTLAFFSKPNIRSCH